LLALLLLFYLLLGLSYAAATPPLESSDEYKHYPVVQYIQQEGALPVLDPDDPGRWLQEGAQPPLYYLLMAGLTAWVDTSDLPELHQVNEHAFIGNPNQVGNKNLILHDPAQEAFPWHGSVLAIYVIRLATLLLGAGTLLLVYRLGTVAFNQTVGLLAATLVAFNPMYLFVHAAVNNDALSILLGHAALYVLFLIWRDVPEPRRHWRRYALLGLLLGLGLLTKLSLGALLLLSGVALAVLAWRRQQWQLLFLGGGIVAGIALLLAAPWLWRNWQLFGDPTAMNVFIAVQGTRDEAMTLVDWQAEFGTFYRSFWGLFGGVNIAAPQFVYTLYNLFALVTTAAFGLWFWRNRDRQPRGLWLLLAWPLLIFLFLLRWTIISPAFQGRLIFPAVGALAILAAQGLLGLLPDDLRRRFAIPLVLAAFAIAALLPWQTIRPAYAYPQPLAEVPEEARFGPVRFQAPDGEIQLVGVDVPALQSVTPGHEAVEVTLYWKVTEAVQSNYLTTVHLLGRELESVGAVNRHPARGMIPTSRWQEGQIYRDVYHLVASPRAEAPTRLRLSVALFDPETDQNLPMFDPGGNQLSLLLVGEARLASASGTEPSAPPVSEQVSFAQGIRLQGYGLSPQTPRPGDTVELDLYWQATATPDVDYTVFIHLLRGEEQVLVADGAPLAGDYPTSLWRDGDALVDTHTIPLPADLPPGDYEIAVGLYDPTTGARLPREDGGDSVRIPLEVGGVETGGMEDRRLESCCSNSTRHAERT
jgi:4-amino-4-deoxy-L-arabinose transferase-like glycosyltransferase